jgi:hypothetical protein
VTHTVEVPAARLAGWVDRYAATHPGTVAVLDAGGVRLDADSGASALLLPLLAFEPSAGTESADRSDLVGALADHAGQTLAVALLLIRRGGYAVGIVRGGKLLQSKVGTRYVQSRTAAGGWSQQRFARRREGQAKDLVRSAADAWSALPKSPRPTAVVTGGDRSLCEQLLSEPATRDLHDLSVLRHVDVPDPRLAVLQSAALRVQSLLVTIREP